MFGGMPVLALSLPGAKPAASKTYPIFSKEMVERDPALQLLSRAGLFDIEGEDNQVTLPLHYASEQPAEAYEEGLAGVLFQLEQNSTYAEHEAKARSALDSGDVDTARAILAPYAGAITNFQQTVRSALAKGDLFLFLPRFPSWFS